jgi:hypothetical protein
MFPLMLMHKLIVQLVLTQTDTHQAITRGDTLEVAGRDYASAHRFSQSAIQNDYNGCEGGLLLVTLDALVMCFITVRETNSMQGFYKQNSCITRLKGTYEVHPLTI